MDHSPPPNPAPPPYIAPPTVCSWDQRLTQCYGLTLDIHAPTAALCEARCCFDASCVKWEFGVGTAGCHRGLDTNCTSITPVMGQTYAMGHKLNTNLSSVDGLTLASASGDNETDTSDSDGDGLAEGSRGLGIEVVIISASTGLALLILVLGCGWHRFYDKQAQTRRVHPLTAAERRAAREKERREKDPAVAPKVHAHPHLTTGAYTDLVGRLDADADADFDVLSERSGASSAGSSLALGDAGSWARTQMVQSRKSAARAAERGDTDLMSADDIEDEFAAGIGGSRPVSASQISLGSQGTPKRSVRTGPSPAEILSKAVKDNRPEAQKAKALQERVERAKRAFEARARAPVPPLPLSAPGGPSSNSPARARTSDDEDDDFPDGASPRPSPPATGSSSGSAASPRGVRKQPGGLGNYLVRPKE